MAHAAALALREELEMIRQYVYWWWSARAQKPSQRSWARALGVHHSWIGILVRKFQADPAACRMQPDPSFAALELARERTEEMRRRGEIRPLRRRRLKVAAY